MFTLTHFIYIYINISTASFISYNHFDSSFYRLQFKDHLCLYINDLYHLSLSLE